MTDGGNRGVSELPAHLCPRAGPHPGHDDRPEHDSHPPGPSPADAEPGAALESAPRTRGKLTLQFAAAPEPREADTPPGTIRQEM